MRITALLPIIFLMACAPVAVPTQVPPAEASGSGGQLIVVEGVDIWKDVAPTRRYAVVASNVQVSVDPVRLNDQSAGEPTAVFPAQRMAAIARLARDRGAPAALVRTIERTAPPSTRDMFASYEYQVDLIRYVE